MAGTWVHLLSSHGKVWAGCMAEQGLDWHWLFHWWMVVIKPLSYILICKMGAMTVPLMKVRIGKRTLHGAWQMVAIKKLRLLLLLLLSLF